MPHGCPAELHGNCFSEICANPKCKAEFLRDFDVGSKRGQSYPPQPGYCPSSDVFLPLLQLAGPYFKGVKDTTQISHITGESQLAWSDFCDLLLPQRP